MSAKSLRCRPSTNAPRLAHWRIASPSATVSPTSVRAIVVSISRSGCTTTAVRPFGTGSRITSGGFGVRTRTKPPYSDGAMLSACADPAPRCSPRRAHASNRSNELFAPTSASTATTAATALAALPPRPLASGRPLRIVSPTPRRSPSASRSACAATPAVFFAASRGRRPASPTMSSMIAPRTPLSANRAVTSSPGESSANPSTSNPHATFDTVAGANAVTESTSTY